MSFQKRAIEQNKRYKLLGKLKMLSRELRKCVPASEDSSLPAATRALYMTHRQLLQEEIVNCELALDGLVIKY